MATVKDVFEIMPHQNTGHCPGVVAVLDRVVSDSLDGLIGKIATVRMPAGRVIDIRIDDARYHGTAHSLFFNALSVDDVPIGSFITIAE